MFTQSCNLLIIIISVTCIVSLTKWLVIVIVIVWLVSHTFSLHVDIISLTKVNKRDFSAHYWPAFILVSYGNKTYNLVIVLIRIVWVPDPDYTQEVWLHGW